jgi:hypothetical protein
MYNICNGYVVKPCVGVCNIIYSTNIDVKKKVCLLMNFIHYFKNQTMKTVLYFVMSCILKNKSKWFNSLVQY